MLAVLLTSVHVYMCFVMIAHTTVQSLLKGTDVQECTPGQCN